MDFLSIAVAVGVLALLIGAIVTVYVWKNRGKSKQRDPDYKALFILGICFLPLGTLSFSAGNPGMFGLTALGLIYMSIGLAHRDKWKK